MKNEKEILLLWREFVDNNRFLQSEMNFIHIFLMFYCEMCNILMGCLFLVHFFSKLYFILLLGIGGDEMFVVTLKEIQVH